MKYCINCGEPLEEHFKFCTSCQAKQPEPVNKENQSRTQDAEQPVSTEGPLSMHIPEQRTSQEKPLPAQQPEPMEDMIASNSGPPSNRKPMQPRSKILLSIAAVLAVLLIGTHFVITSYISPERKLDAMNKAVQEENRQAFFEQVNFDEDALLDEAGYFKYISENEWDGAYKQAKEAAAAKDGLSHEIHSNDGVRLFEIKPKPFLKLYKTYTIAAVPVVLDVGATLDNTEISVAGEKKTISAKKNAEYLAYPGSYKFEATASNLYGDFTKKDMISIDKQDAVDYEVEFDGEMYTFDTDQSAATLVIDGKNTNRQLKDMSEIGPFPKGSKASVQAEWKNGDGKVVKSAKTPVANADGNHIVFIFDDSLLTEGPPKETIDSDAASELVVEFRDAYENALNTKNYSLISPYLLEGSTAHKELKTYISDLNGKDFDYYFLSNDIENVNKVNDFTVKVTTREQFTFVNENGDSTDYDRLKVYTVKVAGAAYKISDISYVKTKRDKN